MSAAACLGQVGKNARVVWKKRCELLGRIGCDGEHFFDHRMQRLGHFPKRRRFNLLVAASYAYVCCYWTIGRPKSTPDPSGPRPGCPGGLPPQPERPGVPLYRLPLQPAKVVVVIVEIGRLPGGSRQRGQLDRGVNWSRHGVGRSWPRGGTHSRLRATRSTPFDLGQYVSIIVVYGARAVDAGQVKVGAEIGRVIVVLVDDVVSALA